MHIVDSKVGMFARGQLDCKKGIQAKPAQSQEYYDGYSFQYAVEATESHQSERRETA